ncbi:MAG: protein translocase subunit SecD [Coxiellaceae bacterium]|jgi:preprotein translocase subunit SecD|nr:protein translocase subunit SecD [Coxiellaceae bacterium]
MRNHYPLWKNLLLLFLLIAAIIYAVPNLFGYDPALQISTKDASVISDDISKQVELILTRHHLNYLTIEHHKGNLLIRFTNLDIQLKAHDLVKDLFSEDYIVALNLASRNPKWLNILGANPMKLGLDLCGGVHFLLAVDIDDMIKKKESGDLKSIINDLREAGIRYVAVEHVNPYGAVITFRDLDNLTKGENKLKHYLQNYSFTRNTTGSLVKLQIAMSEQAVTKIIDNAIEQIVNTLRNRVNELGISEAIVQRQGSDHISVDLPGIQDTTRAKELIGKTAALRFHLVDTEHNIETAISGNVPIGTKLYEYEEHKLLLKDQVVLQGNSITYSDARFSQDGRHAVSVHLGGGGESIFHRITAENIGKPMAVVYVETESERKTIDGKVVIVSHPIERIISVATIQSALGNNFEITGLQNSKYAQDLALLLRSGALIAPVTFVEELAVGPSMGNANINKGILSILVGYFFVMLFMVFYYRLFGLIASGAFLLNLVFVSAILSVLGAVLTLPGMAGMVLAVGMAVDACILIYERIKEELRKGVSPQASIYLGYDHAVATIIDANAATLIVTMVLYTLGTGAVKGFAIVLMIGLITSMLTSIVFTRAIINLIYGDRIVKKLAIGA